MARRRRCYTKLGRSWGVRRVHLHANVHVILHGRDVDQVIDRGDTRAFHKEIVVIGSNKHQVVEVKQIPFTNDEEFAKTADALV